MLQLCLWGWRDIAQAIQLGVLVSRPCNLIQWIQHLFHIASHCRLPWPLGKRCWDLNTRKEARPVSYEHKVFTGHTTCLPFWLQEQFVIIFLRKQNHLKLSLLIIIINILVLSTATRAVESSNYGQDITVGFYFSGQLFRATKCHGDIFWGGRHNYISFSLFIDS